jgi:hypothetical protein
MKVIYLDQNAACYLTKSSPDEVWRKIREALIKGFGDKKLICPLPFECIMETAPRPLELRQAIQSFFWQLSEGVAFKNSTGISNELTLGLIRPMTD